MEVFIIEVKSFKGCVIFSLTMTFFVKLTAQVEDRDFTPTLSYLCLVVIQTRGESTL